MNTLPLFDRSLMRKRYLRAIANGYERFLLDYAIADLGERLSVITRRFKNAADVGTVLPEAGRFLKEAGIVEELVHLTPVASETSVGIKQIEGDEEALPFGAQEFDLVISLLALQSANDLPGALIQISRSLVPDGLFLGCMLGGNTLTELRQVLMQAEAEIEGGISPRVAPFVEIRDAGALMQRAGFALPVVDCEPLTVRYSSMFNLMHDLRAMGLTNIMTERRKVPFKRQTLMRAAELYAEQFADPDGRLRATFDLVWLLGWAPHESQQKPMRPGSAKMRLADALKVKDV
ncbi:methyltransferase domain-containing protein [Microvirga sp. W0021]|uniref:Methyltransferase domain-containing protein n=1 Tax=Hohaiivirga grylli TaxID=3133970 RepID=A0ABV0BND6_9HYPH